MENNPLLEAGELCSHYNIELSFVDALQQHGLIEYTKEEEHIFIPEHQLPELEKLIRLHYDLDINVEGLDAINHLLQRVKSMQDEIALLRNRLRLYEE